LVPELNDLLVIGRFCRANFEHTFPLSNFVANIRLQFRLDLRPIARQTMQVVQRHAAGTGGSLKVNHWVKFNYRPVDSNLRFWRVKNDIEHRDVDEHTRSICGFADAL
jgi:hypothetical protein